MSTPVRLTMFDAMAVDLPEGTSGNVEVRRFTISESDVAMMRVRSMRTGRGYTPAGDYTKLMRNGSLWMSDTQDEKLDHIEAVRAMQKCEGKRVLVTGLGLGMVIRAAILKTEVAHIDVVEFDQDVINLVEPSLQALAEQNGKTLTVHHGDAYDRAGVFGKTPQNYWGYAWHDIWQDLDTDNRDEMTRMSRSYARSCEKQGFWGRGLLRRMRDRDRREDRRWGW